MEIEIDSTSRSSRLRQDVRESIVLSNKVLTAPGEPEKRHISLKIPTGMSYRAGDYMAVLPINNSKNIRRVLKQYGLPWDAMLNIKASPNTTLPTGHPISVWDVLGAYVELSQVATRKVLFFTPRPYQMLTFVERGKNSLEYTRARSKRKNRISSQGRL